MFTQLYFIAVVFSFFVHIYSYVIAPSATSTAVKGRCPMRHLSKLFTSSINTFGQLAPSPSRTAVLNSRSKNIDPVIIGSSEESDDDEVLNEALPWTTSIGGCSELTYMPMLQKQLNIIKGLGMEQVDIKENFVYQKSSTRPARIGSMSFRNKDFRCVRLTYFDGGDAVQVFNSVWYPSFEHDIPIFGADLISLGKSRVLNVIDFQPIHPTEEYSSKYISHLTDIRNKYPDLHGVLSGKIYDDTSFFSKNMLFGRFTDSSKVMPVVLPAFEEYFDAYLSLMRQSRPNSSSEGMKVVHERQRAYDVYSALKDPAVGLFDAYFGKIWSEQFVHDFLFQLSRESDGNKVDIDHIHASQSAHTKSSQAVHTFAINAQGDVIPQMKVHS